MLVRSNETLTIVGGLNASGAASVNFGTDKIARAGLAQIELASHPLPLDDWRVWDNLTTLLPQTAASDDLAIIEGTFGTDSPSIQSNDFGGGSTTMYARKQVAVPANYIAAGDIQLVISAGMLTTVADTSATVDVQAYAYNGTGGVGSDLCSTAAQSINSLTNAEKTFTLNGASLSPGDVLDIRITIAATDAGNLGVMIAEITNIELKCDIR